MNLHRMTDVSDIRKFVLAGRAKFTLESVKTGKHYTFRSRLFEETKEKPENERIWWVDILSSGGKFEYLCRLKAGKVSVKYGQPRTKPVEAVDWFIRRVWHLQADSLQDVNFYHTNQCGMCGRELTTPESVTKGIGPECSKKLAADGFLFGGL